MPGKSQWLWKSDQNGFQPGKCPPTDSTCTHMHTWAHAHTCTHIWVFRHRALNIYSLKTTVFFILKSFLHSPFLSFALVFMCKVTNIWGSRVEVRMGPCGVAGYKNPCLLHGLCFLHSILRLTPGCVDDCLSALHFQDILFLLLRSLSCHWAVCSSLGLVYWFSLCRDLLLGTPLWPSVWKASLNLSWAPGSQSQLQRNTCCLQSVGTKGHSCYIVIGITRDGGGEYRHLFSHAFL